MVRSRPDKKGHAQDTHSAHTRPCEDGQQQPTSRASAAARGRDDRRRRRRIYVAAGQTPPTGHTAPERRVGDVRQDERSHGRVLQGASGCHPSRDRSFRPSSNRPVRTAPHVARRRAGTSAQAQNMVPDEEWPAFLESLRTPLPATFRITGTRAEAAQLLQQLKDQFFLRGAAEVADGSDNFPAPTAASATSATPAASATPATPATPAQPIPWYPHGFGWTMSASRVEMRRAKHMEDFRAFLVAQTEQVHARRWAARRRDRCATPQRRRLTSVHGAR